MLFLSEKSEVVDYGFHPEVLECQRCYHAAAGCPFDETFLDKERFVHLLYSTGVLAQGSGDGGQAPAM